MPDALYCALCRQFLQGKIEGMYGSKAYVFFEHHPDFESFDNAMKLPCSICSLAWGDARDPPSGYDWKRPIKAYFGYGPIRETLSMKFSISIEGKILDWGSEVIFAPCDWSIESPSPQHPQTSDSTAVLTEFHIPDTLSSNTRSVASLDFVRQKFYQCCETHRRCQTRRQVNSPIYPSRLLDVGTEQHSIVALRDTTSFRQETYVCLSHCWGIVKPLTLNAQTQPALKVGVEVEALPRTYQDAIFVTRLLQVRYIWIDSLCILQDDKDDWAYEAQRMGDIYSNAVCTIAATASKNSSGGLFFERDPVSILPHRVQLDFMQHPPWSHEENDGPSNGEVFLCDASEAAGRYIEEAPLNKRAWVAQERQLSTRIIHFTSKQLFWECHETTACETYRAGLPKWAQANYTVDGTRLKKSMRYIEVGRSDASTDLGNADIDPSEYDIRLDWLLFRDLYSRFALTSPSDKLVAIQGVAKWVGQEIDDYLVAGHWRSQLVQELCWHKSEGGPESNVWRAPTWSWASSDAAIKHSHIAGFHKNHPGLQLDVEVVNLDIKTKVSGELEHASLRIKCKPLYATYTRRWTQHRNHFQASESLKYIRGRTVRERIYLMESLELREGEGVGDARPARRFARPLMTSHMDILYDVDGDLPVQRPPEKKMDISHGYLVLVQHCPHEESCVLPVDTQERRDRRSSWASEIEDRDMGYNTIWNPENEDAAEALLLQTSDNVTFKRIGLLRFQRDRAVQPLLEAHSAAKERVITLI